MHVVGRIYARELQTRCHVILAPFMHTYVAEPLATYHQTGKHTTLGNIALSPAYCRSGARGRCQCFPPRVSQCGGPALMFHTTQQTFRLCPRTQARNKDCTRGLRGRQRDQSCTLSDAPLCLPKYGTGIVLLFALLGVHTPNSCISSAPIKYCQTRFRFKLWRSENPLPYTATTARKSLLC
jgi:hypothetical protein